jgi:hypothetical protein
VEIACPAAPDAPLHFAEYEADAGLLCPRCGYFTEDGLTELLEAELAAFAHKFPALVESSTTLKEDEAEVERVAAKLLRALPNDEDLALELVLAWGLRKFAGVVPEEHLFSCAERALAKLAA